jgi:monoamine oxidase
MNIPLIAVVGGGISGLYIASNLINMGYQVTLFEKSGCLGGRIKSVAVKQWGNIEAGAGRFNEKHTLLLNLIHVCGLQHKITSIDIQNRWYHSGNIVSNKNYKEYVINILFKNLERWSAKYTKRQLMKMTMKDLLISEYPADVVEHIISAFGYNSEFEIQNAYTTLNILGKEFNDKIQYFYLQGGLTQLVNCLKTKILQSGGTILYNTTVCDYNPKNNIVHYKQTQRQSIQHKTFHKVIFACTKSALESFEHLLEYDAKLMYFLNSISMAPLNRMFAVFPRNRDEKAWFDGVHRTTTSLPIRYIIPYDSQSGLIQISYTDNDFAKYWKTKSNKQCKDEVVKYLKLIFPQKNIPKPIWLKNFYWDEGVTYWKPSFQTYQNLKNKPYYIAGEIMSINHSGWIEGALQSAEDVVKLFTTH